MLARAKPLLDTFCTKLPAGSYQALLDSCMHCWPLNPFMQHHKPDSHRPEHGPDCFAFLVQSCLLIGVELCPI